MDSDDQKMQVMSNTQIIDDKEEALPGFRFHPTDQELVGFYLRRKVDKKLLNIDLIKQIDIYKYDPWDLPYVGSDLGEKQEWYFFCRRGRKYRNSIRPNRITGSGFWKATGIDRPIYNSNSSYNSACNIIGLKKSLVYYRGCAGKGTKTEWMMHEFRLPPSSHININHMDDKSLSQEAEVWTLCRILKRSSVSHRKTMPDWREFSAKRNMISTINVVDTSSKTCSTDSDQDIQSYISFQSPLNHHKNLLISHNQHHIMNHSTDHISTTSCAASDQAPSGTASSSSFSDLNHLNDFIKHGDWDDLRSVVEFAATDGPVFFM